MLGQRDLEVVQHGWVLDGRRHLVFISVDNLTHGLAQHLARTSFWQARHDDHVLESGNRANDLTNVCDDLLAQLLGVNLETVLERDEADGSLAL